MVGAAVNRDLVTAFHETLSQLFNTGLKPTIICGDAARTQHSNLHDSIPSVSFRCLIIRAGEPATIAKAGTSLVTTLPAATMAPEPMRTPSRMIAPAPIQQSFSTTIP